MTVVYHNRIPHYGDVFLWDEVLIVVDIPTILESVGKYEKLIGVLTSGGLDYSL